MSNRKHRARIGKCEAITHEYSWGVIYCPQPSTVQMSCIWGKACIDNDVHNHKHELCHAHGAQLAAYQN